MSKFQEAVANKMRPIAGAMGKSVYIQAIAQGMMGTLALTIAGSLFLLIANLPSTAYVNWITKIGIAGALNSVAGATTNLLGLLCVFLISYNLAKAKDLDPLAAGLLALASYVIVMPQSIVQGKNAVAALDYNYLGSGGVFVAIFVAIITVIMYEFINQKGWKIKMPDGVPEMVERSFEPIIAAFIIFFAFAVIKFAFASLSFGNVFTFIQTVIQKPLVSVTASPLAFILIWTFINLLWWCGIHPSAITSLMMPIMTTIQLENLHAFQLGKTIPNMTVDFNNLMTIGGTGGTLGLCIMMAFMARSERCKTLGRMAIIPSIFNINEPIIFGLPVVMNPYLFVPMLLTPAATGIVAYLGLSSGLVSYSHGLNLPWTMPTFGIEFLNGGISLLILTILCTLVAAVLYYPFFKIIDKEFKKQETESAK